MTVMVNYVSRGQSDIKQFKRRDKIKATII